MYQREEVKKDEGRSEDEIVWGIEGGYPTGHFALQNEGCMCREKN